MVDLTDPARRRTRRSSVAITRDVVQQREVVSRGARRRDGRLHPAAGLLRRRRRPARRRRCTAHSTPAGRSSSSTCAATPAATSRPPATIASQFIGSGPIFWEQDATGDQVATDARARRRRHRPGASSSSCLIDGGSASASEIVAGALQDTRPGDARRPDVVRQGHRPAVAGAARRGRRVPADDRPLADAGQALDPRRRARPRTSSSTLPGPAARPEPTRPSTRRSSCSMRRRSAPAAPRGRLTAGRAGAALLRSIRASGTVPGNERR